MGGGTCEHGRRYLRARTEVPASKDGDTSAQSSRLHRFFLIVVAVLWRKICRAEYKIRATPIS